MALLVDGGRRALYEVCERTFGRGETGRGGCSVEVFRSEENGAFSMSGAFMPRGSHVAFATIVWAHLKSRLVNVRLLCNASS